LAINDRALEQLPSEALRGRVPLGLMEDIATLLMSSALRRFTVSSPQVAIELRTGTI
jgi:hypothetical protein